MVSLFADEEYRAVQDKLAKARKANLAQYHKFVENLDELIKLSKLKRELSQELESLYKKSLV